MKKRYIQCFCLPLACLLALTACAPGGETADADAEPLPIEVPPPVEQTNEGLTIFYTDYDSYKVSILDAAVNQYNLQHPDQLARYELLSNCIACGVCEGSCPVFAGGEAFIGPAALITASRFINDSRDTQAAERMDAIDTADGIAACQSVRACTRECPRGIDVGEEIWQLIAQVKER